ncbi:MAG: phosphoribosylformylglycinamidine cyclo-ligase, partial [Burkholderiaceae bacterium]|nr:phosphoribosylformylglycinamidine cyclo-ligase [Burkholderiaceae bacterium]
ITGGGLTENIPRVLPAHLAAHLTRADWPRSELFAWLAQTAGIDAPEMSRTFNDGIGLVAVVAPEAADAAAATLRAQGETVYRIGTIVIGVGVKFT